MSPRGSARRGSTLCTTISSWSGPASDPAGIRGMRHAPPALRKIAEKGALFVTRGDMSGTHVAEMGLWKKAGLKPAGPWYKVYEKGSLGNVPTLRYADENGAYTVIDRATLLTLRNEVKLVIMVEKCPDLLNYITLIPVNPKKFPKARYDDAMAFVAWLTSPEKGQKVIRDFGKETYGAPLFFPNSKQWRSMQGGSAGVK